MSYLALPGVERVVRDNGLIRLTVAQVHITVPGLMRLLAEKAGRLVRLTTHHATLEDVFLVMTGRHLRDE